MNTRRRMLVALGAAALMPCAVLAQPKKAPIVVGWLSIGSSDQLQRELTAFKEALSAHGWKDGANAVIEARWAEGRPDRMPLLIELLALIGCPLLHWDEGGVSGGVNELRSRLYLQCNSCRLVCRSDSEGRKARRLADRGAIEIRARGKSQNRKSARHNSAPAIMVRTNRVIE